MWPSPAPAATVPGVPCNMRQAEGMAAEKQTREEAMAVLQANSARLKSQLEASIAEISKGNGIISKLQSDKRDGASACRPPVSVRRATADCRPGQRGREEAQHPMPTLPRSFPTPPPPCVLHVCADCDATLRCVLGLGSPLVRPCGAQCDRS